ncbi:hypothetical protein HLB23_11225 [Nocardia uniformis]|uniref:Uncharacterized protein n=1 Tax=Nocardia uniformis TaxID=53432 RepID=A0A849C272_9NOCA|nr:hypothetical protein [Nocardia uniformis]NNH70425.1 hypothetical protein [Nocardia uniformis]
MYFFVTATMTDPEKAAQYRDEETRVQNELRAEGVVISAYLRTDGQGLVGIVQGSDLADVQTHLARLPFVANGLMAFEYAEVVPL